MITSIVMSARSELAATLVCVLALVGCETKRIIQVAPAPASATAPEDGEGTAPPKAKDTARLPDEAPPSLDPDVPQAKLIDSFPKSDDESFYPVELYDRGENRGVGERRLLRFSFDRPMARDRETVKIRPGGRELQGVWSADGTSLEVTIVGDDEQSPFEELTEYEIDLAALRSDEGEPVGTPAIRFITAARDELIEHACLHTLFGPYESVTAAEPDTALASAPLASATHKQYTIALPASGGTHAGDIRVSFNGTGTKKYALLVDGEAEIVLRDGGGNELPTMKSTTVAACPAIQRRFDMELPRGSAHRLAVTSVRAEIKAIWEAP